MLGRGEEMILRARLLALVSLLPVDIPGFVMNIQEKWKETNRKCQLVS